MKFGGVVYASHEEVAELDRNREMGHEAMVSGAIRLRRTDLIQLHKMRPKPSTGPQHHLPTHRRLRGFSFDPSLSSKADTAPINERTYSVPWESLEPGPVGKYVEVVDVDPASGCFYEAVNLDAPHLLAQDGLPPLSSNPQFHQQLVYAVAMTTIQNFERALGRPVMWADRDPADIGKTWGTCTEEEKKSFFVERLRIYPHALREANAYYSPAKKSLLFGYFPTSELGGDVYYPGGIVFSCLSHDIIAHETTHAILDGIYPRFMEVTQPDGLAFHEAFADIVAMFQHFTFTEVVRHQIAKTRGDLEMNNLLGELAQEFGRATGNHGSLRSALGEVDNETGKWTRRPPDPRRMDTDTEPHDRGSILVSAVFDAFITIYNSRIADLRRIASGGTGILQEGELHPDLVNRLTKEAVKAAGHVLTICIRALDYCPPVDISFGDYLRALITADKDVVPDGRFYRLAFIDAFRQHGIFPKKLRSLSEESLTWDSAVEALEDYTKLAAMGALLKPYFEKLGWSSDRFERWDATRKQRADLHWNLQSKFWREETDEYLQAHTGLDFGITNERGEVRFELHSLWPARRLRPDGTVLNQVVFSILQHLPLDKNQIGKEIWGGCTFIVDLDSMLIRYVVRKPLYKQEDKTGRITLARESLANGGSFSLAGTYGMDGGDEPFAMLHTGH